MRMDVNRDEQLMNDDRESSFLILVYCLVFLFFSCLYLLTHSKRFSLSVVRSFIGLFALELEERERERLVATQSAKVRKSMFEWMG